MSDMSKTAGIELYEELLKNLQCIFTWCPSKILDQPQTLIESLHSKEEELEKEEASAKFFQKLVINIVLCYEYSKENKFKIAMLHQKLIQEMIPSEWSRMKLCLQHMTSACKAYLEFYTKQYKKLKTTLENIISYSQFDDVNKAAVWGLKSAIYMNYGYEGCKLSVGFAEEAIKLDHNCADWNFIHGKSLAVIRRYENHRKMNEKELMSLEKAAELSPCAAYYVSLANAYRETARLTFIANKAHLPSVNNIINELNQKSVYYYRKSLEMSPDSVRVNIRCAQGFSQLAHPFRDLNFALTCLEKVMETAPTNMMALHTIARVHEMKGNLHESEKMFQKVCEMGGFGSHFDLIGIRFKLNPNYNPLPLFEEMLLKYTNEHKKCAILAQIGLYFFLIMNDFNKALHYWQQLMDMDPVSDKLQDAKFACSYTGSSINIERIIIHEVKLLLQGYTSINNFKYYCKVLDRFKDSDILKERPVPQREIIMEGLKNFNICTAKQRRSFPSKYYD